MDPVPRRHLLQTLLESLLGSEEVHFQPPPNTQMDYSDAAIVYKRRNTETVHADNMPYRSVPGYQVTVISRDPDHAVKDKIAALPLCAFDRHYVAENLNHDVYNLFF